MSRNNQPPVNPQGRQVVAVSQQFAGPIPPPAVLAQYNNIIPGAADRILAMAERQAEHRQTSERKLITANIVNERIGLIFAFLIGLGAIGSGVYCVAVGQPIPASFIGGGGVIGLVVAFIYGSKAGKNK